MKKKWYLIPVFCMTAILAFGFAEQNAHAEELKSEEALETYSDEWVNCGPNYEWRGVKDSESGTITIVGYNKLDMLNTGVLEIPAQVDGLTVDSISGIGDYYDKQFNVFSPELVKTLKLPDTVKWISDGVFSHFGNLTTVYLPDNEADVGNPFTNLKGEGCSKLETIYTHDSYSYDSLKKIVFYDGVTAAYVSGGPNLTSVELPATIEQFGCENAPELTTLTCPKSTKDFIITSTKDCPKLCIPVNAGKVNSIDSSYQNSGITELTMTIPDISFGAQKYAFVNCPNLKAINLTNGKKDGFHSEDGVLWWNDDIFAYPAGKSTSGDFKVPENTQCVYVYAFDSCKFTSLTFPENQNFKFYWDSQDSYYYPRKSLIENTSIQKIRVVLGSEAAEYNYTPEKLADRLNINENQVEFYLGNTYSIQYELNGGTNAEGNPTSYRAGETPVTLKNPAKPGAVFLGWKRNDAPDEYTNTTERKYKGYFKDWIYTACWGELPYTDVRGDDWFYEYAVNVYEKKLMTGIKDTMFGPTGILARAQFAVILHRMNEAPKVEYVAKFPDVQDNQWYTDAILWANSTGVVTGYSNTGYFGTGDPITREQMAVMMYRYANYMKYDTSKKADFSQFVDADAVSEFAEDAMRWAVGNGIIKGTENGTKINPQGLAIRAECAAIITRFVDLYQK